MVLGIDIGGTTTKIAGFRKKRICGVVSVQADDPVTSASGALGKFTDEFLLKLKDIDTIAVTGVGANSLGNELFGIPLKRVPEFTAIGHGGLFLAGLEKAVVVSMGTGTALVLADGRNIRHLGGSGVGGGTLIGLARYILNTTDFQNIVDLAGEGDLGNIDLNIRDISKVELGNIPMSATASNFGKHSDKASQPDLALGLVNLVCQSIGMMGVFASREEKVDQIVLTGKLVRLPQAGKIFSRLGKLFGKKFIIPDYAEYSTAVGSAYSISPAGQELI
ncbi:MAG: type II pantothenate kinase [Marinilabiliales bacterium]|nr:MAG: type II pantothenate kinase [Marinilabiliales bacterium]